MGPRRSHHETGSSRAGRGETQDRRGWLDARLAACVAEGYEPVAERMRGVTGARRARARETSWRGPNPEDFFLVQGLRFHSFSRLLLRPLLPIALF